MRAILRILSHTFHRYKLRVLSGYVSVFGAALFAMAIPEVLGQSVNQLLDAGGEKDVSQLYGLAVVLLLAGAARGLFAFGQTYIGENVAQRLAYDLRNEYFDKLQHLSFGFHDEETTGALMSRATADVEGVRMFVNMGAIRMGFVVAMVVGIGVALFLTNVKLAIISLSFVPFISWRAIVSSVSIRAGWLRVQELTAELITVLQENLTGIRVVKAFAAEEYEEGKFREGARRVAAETRDTQVRWARNFSVMNFFFFTSIGAVLWVGGYDVIASSVVVGGEVTYTGLTPGDLTAFIFYMGLLQMPVRMTGWMVNSFSRAASCGERLFGILDTPSPVREREDARVLTGVRGHVVFDAVSFGYDAGRAALEDVSVEVAPGQTVALLGRPGSGKTTFAHLIPRFYDATKGRITIDGTDVRDVTLASLRANVGIVQQDVFIHTASIRDNVAYGDADAPLERVVAATRVAQLGDFVSGLEEGYESVVGERGIGLSGGQKQRLSIARALLTNPPIMILDDSTSSVDAQTEHQLQAAINAAVKDRTTFIITHRLSAIRNANLILVFKDGRIVQRGTHEALMAEGGEYAELYELQLRPQQEAASLGEAASAARDGAAPGGVAP